MTNCSVNWGSFNGSIPDLLLQFYILYCSFICLAGSVCNVLALWCVVRCPKTLTSIKMFLCGLFSSTLLTCLLVMPFMIHLSIAKLLCDRQVSPWTIGVMLTAYLALTEVELFLILILAFFRTLAVWSPQRRHVKLRTSIVLLLGVWLYAAATALAMLAPYWLNAVDRFTGKVMSRTLFALHSLLPVLLTLTCYISTIFVVRRNKRRLATSQNEATTPGQHELMDPATRSMLAVFVSTLCLGLPHSIYHIIPQQTRIFSYTIVHSIFFTHLFVDPLVYLCFNAHHRQRVLHTFTSWTCCVSCKHSAASNSNEASTYSSHATPVTSSTS